VGRDDEAQDPDRSGLQANTAPSGRLGAGALSLHGYFRSTAAWRVRIALNLKGLTATHVSHHLRHGAQRAPDFLRLNPQGLVPVLELTGGVLTQSLAICEWLEETHPVPPLLPEHPLSRARIRAFALAIVADIHPVQNLKVLARLRKLGLPETEVTGWARDVIEDGLKACEALLAGAPGPFCFGASPTLADICLVPQLSNARRFGCDLSTVPRLLAAEATCMALPAFTDAAPDKQADAE
jgi:maleylpyruvate isomerase